MSMLRWWGVTHSKGSLSAKKGDGNLELGTVSQWKGSWGRVLGMEGRERLRGEGSGENKSSSGEQWSARASTEQEKPWQLKNSRTRLAEIPFNPSAMQDCYSPPITHKLLGTSHVFMVLWDMEKVRWSGSNGEEDTGWQPQEQWMMVKF